MEQIETSSATSLVTSSPAPPSLPSGSRSSSSSSSSVYASVLAEEAELINACSAPLRAYLLTNVLPPLIEGLTEVVKVRPADPVDFLAEWLYQYAVKGRQAQTDGLQGQTQDSSTATTR